MDPTALAELRSLLAGLRARPGRTILGLVGAPGAGKSTLARMLAECDPEGSVVVPMDGFHLAQRELLRLGRAERKGAHDTFDGAGYRALLRRLRSQNAAEIVYAPEFERAIEEPIAGTIPVLATHRLVITEGNYLLLDVGGWAPTRALLDAVWYVDVDDALRRQRLLERHVRFGRTEHEARSWMALIDDPNAALVAATRARADRIVQL